MTHNYKYEGMSEEDRNSLVPIINWTPCPTCGDKYCNGDCVDRNTDATDFNEPEETGPAKLDPQDVKCLCRKCCYWHSVNEGCNNE